MLERQDGYPPIGQAGPERPILKVIMVHGVGTCPATAPASAPTWRGRSASRWSRPTPRAFPIEAEAFPGETLGTLTVTRHTNTARDREMLFYELTWSPISQPAKDAIAFDAPRLRSPAGERQQPVQALHQRRRPRSPGLHRHRTRAYPTTVGQALCWALSADWQGLPDEQQLCT